jgi:hypothetical protein
MVPLSTVIRAARHHEPLKQQLGLVDGLVFEMAQGPANAPLAWGVLAAAVASLMFVGVTRLSVPSTIRVVSEPAGAEVVVDGTVRGTAPLAIKDLPRGRHNIEVREADYQTRTLTVDISAFAQSSYLAKLTPIPPRIEEPQQKQASLSEIFLTKGPESANAAKPAKKAATPSRAQDRTAKAARVAAR